MSRAHVSVVVKEDVAFFKQLSLSVPPPSLRTALERSAKFMRVLNDNWKVRLEEMPAGFVYTLFSIDTDDKLSFEDNFHLSVLIEMCRTNYGRRLNPLVVTFTHPKPKCVKDYIDHFRCPVEFYAGKTSLTLPMKEVDRPLPGDNPMLAELNDQVMIKHLAQLDQDQFTERVKA